MHGSADFLDTHQPPIRVMALHALVYCERLFYLEEVEGIRLADDAVYSGRKLHHDIELTEDAKGRSTYTLSSARLCLTGKLDAIREHEGKWIPVEHKRGRSKRRKGEQPRAWDADLVQIAAYGMLLEEELGTPVTEGRIHYHADNTVVNVNLDEEIRNKTLLAIERAKFLRSLPDRPPITGNERLCIRCSLAPVCLPEEERVLHDPGWDTIRLFPPHLEGKALHILDPDAKIGRSGNTIVVRRDTSEDRFPIDSLSSVVIHGYPQITTQAIHLCAANEIGIYWFSRGGNYIAGLAQEVSPVQRRIRQYQALCDGELCLRLAQRTTLARIESQLRFVLRATRGKERDVDILAAIENMRTCLKGAGRASSIETIRGFEGSAGRAYFSILPRLLRADLPETLIPSARTRRPPTDRFNAILSFGYALLYRSVLAATLSVGLEPAFGYYHTPRSSAHPLVLDLLELFRVALWDIPMIGSLNRLQWNPDEDFIVSANKVWLSSTGKAKAIGIYEKRLQDKWKHPVTGYSLSYERTIELETRLLEKEWSGEPGLFARARLR